MTTDQNVKINIDVESERASRFVRKFRQDIERLKKSLDFTSKSSAFAKNFKVDNSGWNRSTHNVRRYADSLTRASRAESAFARTAQYRGIAVSQSLRQQMNFMQRMARQRAAEERSEARAHLARMSRFRREREALFRMAGNGFRSAGRAGGRAALVGGAAAGYAGRRAILNEVDVDAAEKNAQIYGGLSSQEARKLRDGWANKMSIELGATAAQMLSGYTEALKVGIKPVGAKQFAELSIKAAEAWQIPVESVVDTLGLVNQTLTAAGQAFDIKKLKSSANAIQHLSAKMATTPGKMIEFLRQAAGGIALLGMSQEAGLAFGAASTSLGNRSDESGRLLDFLASRLIEMPRLTRKDGEEGAQARSLVRALGYGSVSQMEKLRRENPDEFVFDLMDRLGKISDPKKQEEMLLFLTGREWLGEMGRLVKGSSTLKEAKALAQESKRLDAIGQVWNIHKTKLGFVFKQIGSGFRMLLGEFGKELSPIATKFGQNFLKWAESMKNSGIGAKFGGALEGLLQGLNIDPDDFLAAGQSPEQLKAAIESWKATGQAIGETLHGLGEGIKSFFSVVQVASGFLGNKGLASLVGFAISLGVALRILMPVVSVLGALAKGIRGIAKALAGIRAGSAAASLLGPGASGAAGAAGAAAAGAGRAGFLKNLLKFGPLAFLGEVLAGAIYKEAQRRDPNGDAFGKNETAQKMREEERRKAEERRNRFGPNSSDYQLNGGSGSNDLKGGSGSDRLFHKTALDDFSRSADRLSSHFESAGARLQLAALTSPNLFGGSAGSFGGGGGGYSAVTPDPSINNLYNPPAIPDYGLGRSGIIKRSKDGTASDSGAAAGSVVGAGKGWTTMRLADGSVVKRTGSRNWRNNNPGNIEYGPFARSMGAIGTDGRFAVFPSYEAGRKAKEKLLFEGKGYRGKTLAQAISRYAPPSENNTSSYIAQVAKAAGVNPNTPLSQLTPVQRKAMLDAMERVEGFRAGKTAVLSGPTRSAGVAGSGAIGLDGVPIKGGIGGQAMAGGAHALGLSALAQELASGGIAGGFNRVTAFKDRFHLGRRSMHNSGLAMDFTLKDPRFSAQAVEDLRKKFSAAGLTEKDYKILDEYKRPSSGATGGHIHAQFQSQVAADAYAKYVEQQRSMAAAASKPGQMTSGVPTPQSITQGVPLPPARPAGAGGAGGAGVPQVNASFTINGITDPQEVANAVNRHIGEAISYRTHDVEHELT